MRRTGLILVALLAAICGEKTTAFEQDQRINGLTIQFGTDAFATTNQFGHAFASGIIQNQIQQSASDNVASGTVSLVFTMPGLGDLTGTNQPSFQVGAVNTIPVMAPGNPTTYSGTSDLDWWYTPRASDISPNRVPAHQFSSSIVATVFTAGPGRLSLNPSPLGNGHFDLSAVAVAATTGSSSMPLQSANYYPPGHRASENLDPQLVSFQTMTNGKLRGNISAKSLAETPIPQAVTGSATQQNYTSANSMLDLLVTGATGFIGIVFVTPSQPDKVDSDAPAAGAGAPYTLSANPMTKIVTTCRDKNSTIVDLNTCLNAAAYSSYFKFTTDRVIFQYPPDLQISRLISGNIMVEGQFAPNQSIKIKATGDMNVPFTDLDMVTAGSTGSFQYEDMSPGSRRFYRAINP